MCILSGRLVSLQRQKSGSGSLSESRSVFKCSTPIPTPTPMEKAFALPFAQKRRLGLWCCGCRKILENFVSRSRGLQLILLGDGVVMKFYAVFLLGISLSLACGAKATHGPVIDIENPNRDVGTLTQGEIINQVFKITNQGSQLLEILNVGHS